MGGSWGANPLVNVMGILGAQPPYEFLFCSSHFNMSFQLLWKWTKNFALSPLPLVKNLALHH